jgi:hypothetical protein
MSLNYFFFVMFLAESQKPHFVISSAQLISLTLPQSLFFTSGMVNYRCILKYCESDI